MVGEIRKEELVIVGGGVAGLATALALHKVGLRALVLERSDELRVTGAALALFSNAWIALQSLGVAHKLTSIYSPFNKFTITNVGNGVKVVNYVPPQGGRNMAAITVHRKALLEALAEELPTGTIRFSSKLTSIGSTTHTHNSSTPNSSNIIVLGLEDGTIIHTKVLIGCDGVNSLVGKWLGLRDVVESGKSAVRGLGVFPQGHGFDHEFQQFLDKGIRAAIAPLTDKHIHWFIVYNDHLLNKENLMTGKDPKLVKANVIDKLAHFPSTLLDLINQTDLSTITAVPLMFRYPWDVLFAKLSKGRVTVAGDAMHPMPPDLGQGGCSALEDAVILGRHIGNSFIRNGRMIKCEDVEREIELYVKERRWRSAGLIAASYFTGWVQQGEGWFIKFFRDKVYYKFLYSPIRNFLQFDCGTLPTPLEDGHNKSD